jgi:NTP pyrophosphatase (non-canonical NTP hydrolase)
MDFKDYEAAASRTLDLDLMPHSFTPDQALLLNAALGLTGEAGEFADAVKKALFHHHGLDKDQLVKELGDLLFYIRMAALGLNVSLEHIAEENDRKLRKRYPYGFTVERSRNRPPE